MTLKGTILTLLTNHLYGNLIGTSSYIDIFYQILIKHLLFTWLILWMFTRSSAIVHDCRTKTYFYTVKKKKKMEPKKTP